MSITVDDDVLRQIEREVRDVRAQDVSVVEAHASRDWDESDDERVRLEVVLADPRGETWPRAELDDVMRRIRDVGTRLRFDMWITYTTPTPDADDGPDFAPDSDANVEGA